MQHPTVQTRSAQPLWSKAAALTSTALFFLLTGCGLSGNQATPSLAAQTALPQVTAIGARSQPNNIPVDSLMGAVVVPVFTLSAQGQVATPQSTFGVFATNPGINPGYGPITGGTGIPTLVFPTALSTQGTSSTPAVLITTAATATPTITNTPEPTVAPATLTPLPIPTGTPAPSLRSDLMGIQIHPFITDVEWDAMLGRARELGVQWVKLQVAWREYEPAKGNYNTGFNDLVLKIQRTSVQGFKTMISIAKAPGWARPAGADYNEDGPPANPQDLADFTAALIRTVKPEFINAVEVWNEPNLRREWRDAPLTGTAYFPYFVATYDAIQAIQRDFTPVPGKLDQRITVVTAGPAPTSTASDGGSLDDITWLEQLYQAGLARYTTDVAIGVHPYGWGNAPEAVCCTAASGVTGWYEDPHFYFAETLNRYLQIRDANGHSAKLWVTEFGWATFDGLRKKDGSPAPADPRVGWQAILNQSQQADYVARAFQMMQKPPYIDQLGPAMLWNLNFALVADLVEQSREEAGFSLLDQNGANRPVFNAIAGAPKILP